MSRVQLDGASRPLRASDTGRARGGAAGPTHATVFGLDVRADRGLSFLEGATAEPTGRTLELSIRDARDSAPEWPEQAELICDQHEAGGAVGFQIECHPRAGYRIWGPAHGTHLLSPDGRRLACFPSTPHADTGWERLLIAQALPFAAALRGLEVFHAGAVLLDGAAIAFAGPSGSGKSSTVVELCRGGARFMADDVLALEHGRDGQGNGELLAHPGTPLAGLDRRAETVSGKDSRPLWVIAEDDPLRVIAEDDRELMVRMQGAERAAQLGALFFLDRRAEGPEEPRFERVEHARALLTATFNFVLASPDRLRRLLEVCALAAEGRVERIVFGPAAGSAVVAAAVQERLSGGA